MEQTIQIQLAPTGCTGTRAVVTTKRLFRKPIVETYICHRSTPITGGQWVNEDTGRAASMDLCGEMNDSAQAAANLLCLQPNDQRGDMTTSAAHLGQASGQFGAR